MLNGSPDLPQKSLQIKQDDKFFSRLMSKETSMANSSSRIYYGRASGSVPFMWESQPGTPKHQFSDTTLPPLTPPPSYQSTTPNSKTIQKNINKPKFLNTIFPARVTTITATTPKKKNYVSSSFSSRSCTSSSSSSSPSSSSSWSSSRSINSKFHRRYFSCSSRSRIHYGMDDDDQDHQGHGSPTSTLCYGFKPKTFNGSGGCYSLVNMKNAFLSIVGHGSSSEGTA